MALVVPERGLEGADWLLVRCGACGSRFSPDRRVASYEDGLTPENPPCDTGTDLYLEVGAGLDVMVAPLGWLRPGNGSLLEIGGSVGFVSDYARQALGWTTKGYDPSLMAAIGRKLLGLDVELDYFQDDTPLAAAYDIVSATELIEHVPNPAALLRTLSRGVSANGLLVLTTPDGDALQPQASMALLGPLVSPGLHLTLFTSRGLQNLLHAVGFGHVRVQANSGTLTAHASRAPLPAEIDSGLDHGLFQTYLRRRLASPPPGGLYPRLESGLRFRLLKDLIQTGAYTEALVEFETYAAQARKHFGLDLSQPKTLLDLPRFGSLSALMAWGPSNLAAALHLRAVVANNHEGDGMLAAAYAGAAALAGLSLRRVLNRIGMDNGEAGILIPIDLHLALQALANNGADIRPLLGTITQAPPSEGFLLTATEQEALSALLQPACDALRSAPVAGDGTVHPEKALVDVLRASPAVIEREILDRLEKAVTIGEITAALDGIAASPIRAWLSRVNHCVKTALIRLVQLSAYEEALTLFRDRGDEAWLAEEAVASALHIAEAAVEAMALKTAAERDVRACVDQGQVRARVDALAAHPRLSGRPDIVGHCTKMALIRLVELSAYEEAP
ncbi:MAG: class I SAM-dependent methyltransferase [Azospirillaceae bacterium]|nr:class I SAM-dependent methyltransferase [Azospirillaceae bacterium]